MATPKQISNRDEDGLADALTRLVLADHFRDFYVQVMELGDLKIGEISKERIEEFRDFVIDEATYEGSDIVSMYQENPEDELIELLDEELTKLWKEFTKEDK